MAGMSAYETVKPVTAINSQFSRARRDLPVCLACLGRHQRYNDINRDMDGAGIGGKVFQTQGAFSVRIFANRFI